MAHLLLVRAWQWLRRQLQYEWRERTAGTDPVVLSRHKYGLVERGASYGLGELREIERRLPMIQSTLVLTIEKELSALLDGSEDWETVEELVDGIVEGEFRGGPREGNGRFQT
jgi:hypothetical protein